MAKSIHLPCKNKPLHTAECSECSQLEHRVENLEECCEDVNEALAGKQDVLESGENIKTINGESVLGSGNIEIQGGGGDTVSFTQTQQSGNELGTITINGTGTNIYSPTETDPTVPSWAKASTKPSYTASEVGAVPTTRKVNNKALSSDVTLDASDVGAQETLVSGTNIKTVNSTSLLGSGNVAVQPTLVSGTNIKTVNNESLLGSGNITIQGGGGGSTVSYTQTQTSGNELGTITIDGTPSKIYSPRGGIVVLSVSSFSSLPQTVSDAIITADMICLKSELGTPSAQTGDWTITTASGSLTIAGTISGSTTATLYLARKEN